jgi:hypothetical protein
MQWLKLCPHKFMVAVTKEKSLGLLQLKGEILLDSGISQCGHLRITG